MRAPSNRDSGRCTTAIGYGLGAIVAAIRLTIDAINNHVSSGALYKALKEIGKLMKREDALLATFRVCRAPQARPLPCP
jgi:Na+/proline symporter